MSFFKSLMDGFKGVIGLGDDEELAKVQKKQLEAARQKALLDQQNEMNNVVKIEEAVDPVSMAVDDTVRKKNAAGSFSSGIGLTT